MSATEHYFRFAANPTAEEKVVWTGDDPTPYVALETLAQAGEFTVRILPPGGSEAFPDRLPDEGTSLYVKLRGVELLWNAQRAVLRCEAQTAVEVIPALLEFSHIEKELTRIEGEVKTSWSDLGEDNSLAFEVTTASLKRSQVVRERMLRTLQWRQALARMEARLFAADPVLSPVGRKVGDELRERADIEARTEVLDGRIETFEHVYEMASQRMGEFAAARQGHITELVIIVILAMETLLMLGQFLHGRG